MMRSFRLPPLVGWIIWIAVILVIFMTLMRLGFYFYFNKQGNSISDLRPVFWMGLRFDLRTVSVILLPLLLLGSFPVFNPFKRKMAQSVWIWLLGVVCFVMILFFVVDFAHYAYLIQRLNASALNYLEDAGISASMVWQSYPVIRLLIVLAVGTGILVWLIRKAFHRISRSFDKPAGKGSAVAASIVCFLVLGFLVFGRFNQYPLRWSDAFGLGNDYKANLALNPFESFFNTLSFRAAGYEENKVREAFPSLAPYFGWNAANPLNYKRMVNASDSVALSPLNVVLVICESFSGYKSSMWGNPLNTTPFFDSLCRNGLFFDHCFTPTYGTARGVWATLTGLPDVAMQQTSSRNPLAVDQHTIINDFKNHEKYYFIGGSPSWANIRGVLMNNIADLKLYDQETFEAPKLDVWGISDKNLFLESNKVLAKERKPFFAIIQTADNHRPYTIPSEDTDFEIRKVPEDSLNRFGFTDQVSYSDKLKEYNAFRYTDYTFRKFMEAASKEPYFSNTVFVFVGDHGIAGDAGNMFPDAWTHQRLTAMHVPLLFYAPGKIAATRVNKICSQVDILPTVASLCGIQYANTTLGRNLTDSAHLKPFAFIFDPDYSQAGIVMDNYFYRRQMRTGKEEMVPIKSDSTLPLAPSPVLQEEMKKLTGAVYETARYLLLNNKKEK